MVLVGASRGTAGPVCVALELFLLYYCCGYKGYSHAKDQPSDSSNTCFVLLGHHACMVSVSKLFTCIMHGFGEQTRCCCKIFLAIMATSDWTLSSLGLTRLVIYLVTICTNDQSVHCPDPEFC